MTVGMVPQRTSRISRQSVNWNQTGPQWSQGPQGAAGPAGPHGPAGGDVYSWISGTRQPASWNLRIRSVQLHAVRPPQGIRPAPAAAQC